MASADVDDMGGWRSFFNKVASFLEGAEQHYGVANENFTEFVVDRLDLIIQSCNAINDHFSSVTLRALSVEDRGVMLEYHSTVQDLTTELRSILNRWQDYGSVLNAAIGSSQFSY